MIDRVVAKTLKSHVSLSSARYFLILFPCSVCIVAEV